MSEEATLKDVTVAPNPADAAKAEGTSGTKTAEPEKKVEVTDPAQAEALEVGRILLESGYSKAQINDLMQAPRALASLKALLENDPKQFVKQYALNNPEGASKFREAIAEEFVELYGDKGKKADSGKSADSELMGEVAALRDEVKGYRTAQEQAAARTALAAIQARYNSRVDEFFSQDGIKGLGLTKVDEKGMRALLDKELASDPSIVQRVSSGNFVDVAPAFKRILDERAAETKAKIEADKQARERIKSNSVFTLPGAAEPIQVPTEASESWDATEEAFAKALNSTR